MTASWRPRSRGSWLLTCVFVLVLALLAGAAAVIVLAALDLSAASFEEVARVTSPSEHVDAVVIESNGGATTPFGYFVCVTRRGGTCDADDAAVRLISAFRSDGRGVDLRWDGKARLRIEYQAARRIDVHADTVTVDGDEIRITLHPGPA